MNLWILYSLGWLIAIWLWDFIKKLVLSKGGNKEVFLLVCFLLYVPVFWINMWLQWTGNINANTLQSGVILWINNFFAPLWVLIALKYLDIAFALVCIRVVSSFFILFIGIYLLWDNLSLYNIIGFFIWMFAIFLLSWFKIWEKYSLHPKGMIGLFIALIAILFWNSYFKYIVSDINVHDFMPIQFTATLSTLLIYMLIRAKFQYMNYKEIKKVLPYAFFTMVVFVTYFLYLIPNIYLLWPLSLGYKMLSYSLVVPIILSVIFLGEPINRGRIFAFLLTVISIFLFLI